MDITNLINPAILTITAIDMVVELDAGAGHPLDNNTWPTEDEGHDVMDSFINWYMGWKEDQWHYVGVRARATLGMITPDSIPNQDEHYITVGHYASAGTWDVESNSDDYLDDLYLEQVQELLHDLKQIGVTRMTTEVEEELPL